MPKSASPAPPASAAAPAFVPRPRWWHPLALFGPAFVASIAYVDPGNVAANLTSGAQYGYLLVWVLVLANAMAVLIQFQSAKLGIVTGMTLPEHVGARTRPWSRRAFWLQAELVAAATDIAEVIGGALALNLLFGLPLVLGGAIVGVVSMVLLIVQSSRRQRSFEFIIIGLLAVIAVGFLAGIFVSNVDWLAAADGLVPRFDGAPTVLLAASMLGATVMPHAIYLHSALARDRHHAAFAAEAEKSDFTLGGSASLSHSLPLPSRSPLPKRRSFWATRGLRATDVGASSKNSFVLDEGRAEQGRAEQGSAGDGKARGIRPHGAGAERLRGLLRVTRADVVIALVLAGAVNIAMLLLAASSLRGVEGTDSIPGAYDAIAAALGPVIATIFAIGLLASGLASTSVGAYAGSVIMKGLLRVRVPILARRVVTLIPALIVLGAGVDPTWALVLSQVLLSIGIPFALIPLIRLTGNPAVMGEFADRMPVKITAWTVVALIVALNVVLIVLTVTGAA